MKIKSLSLFVALAITLGVNAQDAAVRDTTWKTGGVVTANFSQVSLSNWAAGGFSSISGNGLISLFANRLKGKNSWDTSLELGYGLLKQDVGDGQVRKTDDRIELNSKYGREAWNPNWRYTGLFNFRTQFAEGIGEDILDPNGNIVVNDPVISDLLAPAYILASVGLDYKPNDNFSFYISPVTAKFTIVNDQNLADAGAFGVTRAVTSLDGTILTPGENFRSEFGGYARFAFQKALMENVAFQTRADFFSNYEAPTYIDVNLDALLSLKVNEYITTSIGATVLYDDDIDILDSDGNVGPRTQFKQIFAVGFNYQLK